MRAALLLSSMMLSLATFACGGSDSSSSCGAPSKVQYSTTRLDGGSAPTCDEDQVYGVKLEGDHPLGTEATLPTCVAPKCFCQGNNLSDAGGSWLCPL